LEKQRQFSRILIVDCLSSTLKFSKMLIAIQLEVNNSGENMRP
jgi:hypothetical protein